MKPNRNVVLVAVLALLLVGLAVGNRSGPGGSPAGSGSQPGDGRGSATESGGVVEAPASRFSDLPVVSVEALPIEAVETLLLIEDGGPYPFDRDDLIFQNRERLLPSRAADHYREYTVITPGEDDRGARRVVAGADGERYYTADHYSSFQEILAP